MGSAKDRCHNSEEEEQWLEVPALSAVWMDKVELPQIDCFNEYVSYEAWENDQIISQGTVIFPIRNTSTI